MKYIYLFVIAICLLKVSAYAQPEKLIQEEPFSIEKIYPNPVSEFVFVEMKLDEFSEVDFELIDILGSKVYQWDSRFLSSGNHKVRLVLTSVRTGIYLLKIKINEKVIVKKIRKE